MTRRRSSLLSILIAGALVALLVAPATTNAALTYTYLTKWGGTGTAPGDLAVPFNIAVDTSSRVYTTEMMDKPARGQRFGGNGTPQLIFGAPGSNNGQFTAPEGVAVAYNGDIYVCDSGNGRIVVFDDQGAFKRNFGVSYLTSPSGIAIGKHGHVYVADTGADRIRVFDHKGNLINGWGSHGAGDGEFDNPQDIALDVLGNVYVTDEVNERVQVFDAKGAYVTQWGSRGPGAQEFIGLEGISVDPWFRVYTSESAMNRIQVFDSTGSPLASFGTTGSANGRFNVPWSVAADAYRNVYVADTWNYRVQKFGAPMPTYTWVGAGDNRLQTAVRVAEYGWPDGIFEEIGGKKSAILATARNWPDALAASALAGVYQCPILLVEPNELSGEVADRLAELGANHVIAIGGTAAISQGVLEQVRALPDVASVDRIGGANRYETGELIASRVRAVLGDDYDGGAIVATGRNFPDALAGAPIAYARCWPILLSDGEGLPDGTAGIDRAVVLGGEAAVSGHVYSALHETLGDGSVNRVAGDSRYETAIEIAHWGVSDAGLTWSHTAVSTGENWPDALAGGALQGRFQSVMLLTTGTEPHPAVVETVGDMAFGIGELRFIGGTAAVSQDVRTQLTGLTIDPQ